MLFTPLKPMLLSNDKITPFSLSDPNLLYEPKYDGWRLLLHKQGTKIEIYTRHGNIVTQRFPEFVDAAARLNVNSIILDCEGVCFCQDTLRPDFGLFNARAKLTNTLKISAAINRHPATIIPFDVIMINGHSLCGENLIKRKKQLSDTISNGHGIMLPTYFEGEGQWLYDWTLNNKWEGLCAKDIRSKYQLNKRPISQAWVKKKHTQKIETYILGYVASPFALVVGLKVDDTSLPTPVAFIEFGFKNEEKAAFRKIAKQIHTVIHKGIQMIEPLLKCNIEYLEKTKFGALRICTFRGFII